MKRVAVCLLAAAALAVAAGAASAAQDWPALFPKPQEVAGWSVSYDIQTYPGEKIYDFIDGAGEIFVQYNFEVAASAEYAGPDDGAIAVEFYRMKTPEDAYGIYAYSRPARSEPLDLEQSAFVAGITGGLWKGNYYVKVYALEEKPGIADAVKGFLRVISQRIESTGKLPELFSVLDVEGLVKGSKRFTRTWLPLKNLHFLSDENLLNLGDDTQLVFADYTLKDSRFQAFAVRYPTTEAAVAAASKYARYLGAHRDAEAAWFKQDGRVIIGTWTGIKVSETNDSQDVMNSTIKGIIGKVSVYQLDK